MRLVTLSRLNTFSRCLGNGVHGNEQPAGDVGVALPSGYQAEQFPLSGGPLGYGITGAFPLLEQLVEVRAKQSQQQIPPGGGGQAHHGFVFKTEGVKIALLHTGGVPLPGRHVVRDPQDRQQAMKVLRDLFTDQAWLPATAST